jgi:hypothetical protein
MLFAAKDIMNDKQTLPRVDPLVMTGNSLFYCALSALNDIWCRMIVWCELSAKNGVNGYGNGPFKVKSHYSSRWIDENTRNLGPFKESPYGYWNSILQHKTSADKYIAALNFIASGIKIRLDRR